MSTLASIVAAMTKEEVRHLKLYLNRIETPHDRKDEILFDTIRTQGKKFNEDKIIKKLYGQAGKNAYYRLSGRLQDVICQNLSLLHETKNEKNKLFLYFSVSHIFSDKNNFDLAFAYLRKAEKLALSAENLEMLDLIYANYIKLSNELPEVNPESFIEKRKANAEQLNKLREMDQILAAVVYRLKLSQAKGREDENTLHLLDHISKKYSADDTLLTSKTFQTKIYRAVSQILLQRHNYIELERFMVAIYKKFQKAKWFDKNNHDTKLQMLVYLVNSFSRNHKNEKSLQYADELGKEILAHNRIHYDKYVFYYYNARVINYSESAPVKALEALKELEQKMSGKPNTYYEMFIHLNRGILFFKTGKFNDAIRSFVKYYTNDYYKKSDNLFKFRVAITELMMQVEAKDLEVTLIRLEQVKKQFKNEMNSADAYAESKMYEWLKLVCKNSLKYSSAQVQDSLRVLVKDKKISQLQDNQLINYQAWLRSKIKA
jgi:hypothetical protein